MFDILMVFMKDFSVKGNFEQDNRQITKIGWNEKNVFVFDLSNRTYPDEMPQFVSFSFWSSIFAIEPVYRLSFPVNKGHRFR